MKKYLFIVGLLFPYIMYAQVITGKITNNRKQPLKGASVHWLGTTIGISTGDGGEFKHTGLLPLRHPFDPALGAGAGPLDG